MHLKATITYTHPNELQPRAKNPRTHTKRQIKQIAASIREFGFLNPVLIDTANGIIAGHGRVEAAKLLKMSDIPTVCVDHLKPAQIRAYVIADNKIAENAGWDQALLALELRELSLDFDFDIAITGFETAESDLLIQNRDQDVTDEAEHVSKIDRSVPAVSRRGDLWRIGNHTLLCGDALNEEDYAKLLESKKAQLVFTDPPYNVNIAGNVSGHGKVKHPEFAMASGEMSPSEFTKFLHTSFSRLTEYSTDGSIHFICMDWRHIRELLDAAEPYSMLKNLCVWSKTNAGLGSLYRSQHELIFVLKKGKAPHINNIELGRFGRSRSNVWSYGGQNTFSPNRHAELAMHPTAKPVALVADAILDCSDRGQIVLDAFAGSGTTLIAAEKTGRRGYGIEIDPHFVDLIIRRFETVYDLRATHLNSGLDFAAVTRQRTRKNANGKKHQEPEAPKATGRRNKGSAKSAS